MKRYFKFISLLCIMLAAISCSKKEESGLSVDLGEFTQFAEACGLARECPSIPAEKLAIDHENSGMDADEAQEKLKDLERLPAIMRYILSSTTKITTTKGGISNASGFEYLADREARGWNGATFSSVPGVSVVRDGVCHVVIGTLSTGSDSLLLHEASHCIDKILGFSDKSALLKDLYATYKENPVAQDPNYSYSVSDPQEFFAEHATLSFYSDDSKKNRDKWYPRSKELFEDALIEEMLKALGGQAPAVLAMK